MEQWAEWVAPAATMIAAMMTAANLGVRITGWGFVVFAVGSTAWCVVAATSGQTNLLVTNLLLLAVNVVGIWRWLGREARYAKGSEAATEASEARAGDMLVSANSIAEADLRGRDGRVIATVIDAMIDARTGRVAYVVVREGGVAGVGERLHALARAEVAMRDDGFDTDLSAASLAERTPIPADRWPASADAT